MNIIKTNLSHIISGNAKLATPKREKSEKKIQKSNPQDIGVLLVNNLNR